jgi:succinate-acetate transporter protein
MDSNGPPASALPFAESTPLGLLGLAVGCAALTPVAFGVAMTPSALQTAAWFCLLFGGGGQFLAGMMALANKNLLGGTLFTTFSFNWVINFWVLRELAAGNAPDGSVMMAVDVCFLVIFVVLTYAFAFLTKILALFLLDIDVLYALRIARATLHIAALGPLVGVCTALLAAIALWIAFAMLVNVTAGRAVFAVPGPWLTARPRAVVQAAQAG